MTPRSLLILLVLLMALPGQSREFSLCVDSNDWAPFTYERKEGILQLLARMAAQRTGDVVRFEVSPWRRCQLKVEKGEIDGLIGASTDRYAQESFAFPHLDGTLDESRAVASTGLYLVKAAGSQVTWDGKKLTGFDGAVSTILGYTDIVEKLAALGIPSEATVRSNDQNVHKLLAGRTAVMATYYWDAKTLLADPHYAGKLVMLNPPFGESRYYIAFNKGFYGAQKDAVEAFWNSTRYVRDSPDYQAVIQKFAP